MTVRIYMLVRKSLYMCGNTFIVGKGERCIYTNNLREKFVFQFRSKCSFLRSPKSIFRHNFFAPSSHTSNLYTQDRTFRFKAPVLDVDSRSSGDHDGLELSTPYQEAHVLLLGHCLCQHWDYCYYANANFRGISNSLCILLTNTIWFCFKALYGH